MRALREYPNIGPELERQLKEVEITSIDELESVGTKEAWLRIQQIDPSACIHRLLAIEGALQGIKKTELSNSDKENLRDFYREHKL